MVQWSITVYLNILEYIIVNYGTLWYITCNPRKLLEAAKLRPDHSSDWASHGTPQDIADLCGVFRFRIVGHICMYIPIN